MEKVCNSFHILLNYFKFCYWFPLCSLEELANILSLICLFFWILLVVFAIQKFSVFMLTYLHHFYIHGFVFILRKPIFTWRLWNIFLFSSHIFIVPFFFFPLHLVSFSIRCLFHCKVLGRNPTILFPKDLVDCLNTTCWVNQIFTIL